MWHLIIFAAGAIAGSFLNVCIFRIPGGQSIIFPGSHCLVCKKPIHWFDTIPVLSFFLLKGRCRFCGVKLSWQYPLIELLTGALFVLFYGVYGLSFKALVYLCFALALLVASAIDFRHEIIPDSITLPGIVLGLVVGVSLPGLYGETIWFRGLFQSLLGVFLGGGILYLFGTIAEKILKKEAMGGGDVKLLAMIGAFLGWTGVLWTLFVSSLAGSVVGIYLRISQGREKIPFGPYLALAAFLYLFFGEHVMKWYAGY